MGDQQVLSAGAVRVYHREKTRQVHVVQRGLGLVQDAKSPGSPRRPAQEDAEQERERQQGPLPAREDPQGSPPLAPETDPNLHPLLRQVQSPGRPHEHLRHYLPERPPNPPERLREPYLYLLVHRLYYVVKLGGSLFGVGALGGDELVAFEEVFFLGEGEEVDVAE